MKRDKLEKRRVSLFPASVPVDGRHSHVWEPHSIPDVSPICVVGAITAGCGLYAQIKNGVKSGLIAIALLAIWADSWAMVSYIFLLQLVLSKEVAVGKTPLTNRVL